MEQLTRGELDAVCAVDLFNEGIDVPLVDRVVMLRPSESPVVFLQQLGRGLRRAEGKEALTVLDFVGNHRVFLDRLRTLLDTAPAGAPREILAGWLADAARRTATELPPGCSVNIDLEAIDLLAAMLPKVVNDALVQTFRELVRTRGVRPTAGEMFRLGFNPKAHGGWLAFVEGEGQLLPDEREALQHARQWLTNLETTGLEKCFKMVTLQVLIEADALMSGMDLDELCQRAHALLMRSPELFRDIDGVRDIVDPRQPDPARWRAYWRKNPIKAWLGENTAKKGWFALDGDRFVPRFQVPDDARPALTRLVAELVDWRLAQYRARPQPVHPGSTMFECKLIHAGTAAILKLPARDKLGWLPQEETPVALPDGRIWSFRFKKEFCNVATAPGQEQNRLTELLQG